MLDIQDPQESQLGAVVASQVVFMVTSTHGAEAVGDQARSEHLAVAEVAFTARRSFQLGSHQGCRMRSQQKPLWRVRNLVMRARDATGTAPHALRLWGWRHLRLTAVALLAGLLGVACGAGDVGTAWGDGAFRSNGERIYFTATNERGTRIEYTGGPDLGGMMMGGRLTCASCHGTDGRGGLHTMHMETMDAPNIRWQALVEHATDPHDDTGEHDDTEEKDPPHAAVYDIDTFRLAVIEGKHPDGEQLDEDMPRWGLTETDLEDLAEYLQSFVGP